MKQHMSMQASVVGSTLWLFNIAMENGPFIDDFPIKTSIYKGFSMAMLNNQRVYVLSSSISKIPIWKNCLNSKLGMICHQSASTLVCLRFCKLREVQKKMFLGPLDHPQPAAPICFHQSYDFRSKRTFWSLKSQVAWDLSQSVGASPWDMSEQET